MNTAIQPTPVQDTRNRRTPYHNREAYIVGDSSKKAKIIRAALTLGHPITLNGQPVAEVKSFKGQLWFRCAKSVAWNTGDPLFHYIPKDFKQP